MVQVYTKVLGLFKTNIKTGKDANVVITMQDLTLILLPYLTPTDAFKLFELCLTEQVLCSKDNGIQKRGYKVLAKLVESGKISFTVENVFNELDKLVDGLSSAAKKVPSLYCFGANLTDGMIYVGPHQLACCPRSADPIGPAASFSDTYSRSCSWDEGAL
jgi:hypothetical protein